MKLGVFQPDTEGYPLSKRLDALARCLQNFRLDIILLPELFLSGYHIEGQHQDFAEPVDGPFAVEVSKLAKKFSTAVCYGYPELDDGKIYNSAAFIDHNGTLRANHRKRIMAPGCFERETFTPGKSPTLFSYMGLQTAILICYEIEFSESARQAANLGAELVLVPTALTEQWPIVAEKLIATRAFENGIWLAYANHAGTGTGHTYLGGSRIVAPDGTEMAAADKHETLIFATIDAGRIATARQTIPYLEDSKLISNNKAGPE